MLETSFALQAPYPLANCYQQLCLHAEFTHQSHLVVGFVGSSHSPPVCLCSVYCIADSQVLCGQSSLELCPKSVLPNPWPLCYMAIIDQ